MSWRKWNIRAELDGVEVKPHVKPKINLDVLAAQHGPDSFQTDYVSLNAPVVETRRGEQPEGKAPVQKGVVAATNASQPKRYYVMY